MRIIEERDSRFVNIERKVGIFILIAVVGLALIVGLIGIQRDMFTPKVGIFLSTETAVDLSEGQLVKFQGFKIGRVTKVSLNDEAKVDVRLAINRKYMKWIKSDSTARLMKEGLIGDSVIDILPGSAGKRQLEEGEQITFRRDKGLSEIAAEISDQIKPVLADVKKIIEYINNPQGEFKSILVNSNKLLTSVKENVVTLVDNFQRDTGKITAAVEDLKTTLNRDLDRITDNVDGLSTSITKDVVSKVDAVLKNVDGAVTGVDETISIVKKDLQGIMDRVIAAMENIKNTTEIIEKASSEAPEILTESRQLLEETNKIMDSVQDIWLLSPKPVNPEDKVLKTDSYE